MVILENLEKQEMLVFLVLQGLLGKLESQVIRGFLEILGQLAH